ncbi:MAG: class I SAM-dependent methyltransferase [Alphaproteobacteria bacterium]|nr:class I SAM-dependent methyltransferase [Alphaproteobacteria bacterium]
MSALKREIEHIGFLFQQGGIRKLYEYVSENIAFDLKNGIETSMWLEKGDFTSHPPMFDHGVRYRASLTSEVLQAFQKIAGLMPQASFFDMGCGKGKVLCLAAKTGLFSHITGIDYYPVFLKTAEQNLKNLKQTGVSLVEADMTKFDDFAPDSIIYMYNPADLVVIDKVRENLEKTCRRAIVIYNKPLHAEVFKDWRVIDYKTSPDLDRNTTIFGFNV